MSKYMLLFLSILLLMGCCLFGTACATEEDAISRIKLTPEKLPHGMEISHEIRASKQQLFGLRLKIGFPLKTLLNQTLIYDNMQAKINYMTLPTEGWFVAGYSKLTALDGARTLVLSKGNILLQITTRSREFEDRIVDLLEADPLHRHKIRVNRMTTDWGIRSERFQRGSKLVELDQKIGSQPESSLEQEFLAGRKNLKISYYHCGSEHLATIVAEYLAGKGNPVLKRLVKYSGTLVAMAESQDKELNEYALSFVNW